MPKNDNQKKPKQPHKTEPVIPGRPEAVEAQNQPHNAKKEGLGPNTKRG